MAAMLDCCDTAERLIKEPLSDWLAALSPKSRPPESHAMCKHDDLMAHLLGVHVAVVGAVHHLVAVVLLQYGRVVADALDEQVLPGAVEALPLQ